MISQRAVAPVWPAALAAFLVHFFFSIIVQVENYLFYVVSPRSDLVDIGAFFIRLPFLQLEHAAVALGLGLLAVVMWPVHLARWLFLIIFTLLNAYLVLNQINYHVFFIHLHPSLVEGQVALSDLPDVAGSAAAEADFLTILNILLVLGGTLVVANARLRDGLARLSSQLVYREQPRFSTRFVFTLLVLGYLGGSLVVSKTYTNYNLEHHPLVSLFISPSDVEIPPPGTEFAETLPNALVFGRYGESPQTKETLQRIQTELRTALPRPNVILVVLESVGSKQILQQKGFDPKLTPNLAQLSQNSVIFDSLYTTFPGTVRAHLTLETGGLTITWGSVFRELVYSFLGPTLPRNLKQHGYQTGFVTSGDLHYENMDVYITDIGFDYLFEAGQLSKSEREQHYLHSWGVQEEVLHDRAITWLDSVTTEGEPFFLQLLTVATHHPYSTPDSYSAPFEGDGRQPRYWNALHYTDTVLGRLIDDLEKRELLEDTLILVTGDHGQAFGQLHERNLTHKNYLYEENVKTFLMVSSPVIRHPTTLPLVTDRIGSLGDVMPTLLALTDDPSVSAPGQNLFSSNYTPRPVFFHKNAHPELWGLRDGQWKFITKKIGEESELYDLESDPDEQVNIAQQYPQRLEAYRKLCTQWYLTQNADYVALLDAYQHEGGRALAEEDLQSAGPKILAFGIKPKRKRFTALQDYIHPQEKVVAFTKWVPYTADKTVRYEWISPSGESWSSPFTVKADWSSTWVYLKAQRPLQEGEWQVAIWEDEQALLRNTFVVSAAAELKGPPIQVPILRQAALGWYSQPSGPKDKRFNEKIVFRPNETVVLKTEWEAPSASYQLRATWKAPSGKSWVLNSAIQYSPVYLTHRAICPMETGWWTITVHSPGGKVLKQVPFQVQ